MLTCNQRVICVQSSSEEFIGKTGTVVESSRYRGRTRRGIPVCTTYVRFDALLLSQEGVTTRYIELPTKNLKEISE